MLMNYTEQDSDKKDLIISVSSTKNLKWSLGLELSCRA